MSKLPTAEFNEGWEEGRHSADVEVMHLRAEIERLRALVRSVYAEGFSEGMNEHTKFRGGKPWEDSRACRALEGK